MLCEILTINYVIINKKPVSPKVFVNLATAILHSDMIRSYVLHIIIQDFGEKNYKYNLIKYISHVNNLNKLYNDLIQQFTILQKCVSLVPGVK